jgi:cell division transport system ATP-binding protein
MGIVFQDFKLIPSMTVFDNVAFPMHVVGAPNKKIRRHVREALDTVGLPDKGQRMPAALSGGEQQRVALARALVNIDDPHHACRLIVADEPTGNVDPQMAYEIIQLLSEINQKYHITVLMITHAHDLVRQFNHRVITLDKGRIVADTGRPRRTGAVSLGAIAAEVGGGEG